MTDNKLKKIKNKKYNEISPQVLNEKLCRELDKMPELLDVDEVVIENQPRLMNPIMGRIASCLSTYFVIRGRIDSGKVVGGREGNKINVRNISPTNKLKIDNDRTVRIIKGQKDDKNKYKLTKALSVQYTTLLLSDKQEWLDHLKKYKKKDDLCDALLQGYYYIFLVR